MTYLGGLRELGQKMLDSFQKLTPEQQEQLRKEIYEKTTGQPYRGNIGAVLKMMRLTRSKNHDS